MQRRKSAQRAFTGLAGSPLAVVVQEVFTLTTHPILPDPLVFLYDGRTIDLPPVLMVLPKRGRPFANGVSKKSAAEIKREQRKRERERERGLMEAIRMSQQWQTELTSAQRELDNAVQLLDQFIREQKPQEIIDRLTDAIIDLRDKVVGLDEQREWERQEHRTNRRESRYIGGYPLGSKNGGYGGYVTDAPQGMGKLIYGYSEDADTGRKLVDGKTARVQGDSDHGRRVSAKGTDPSVFEGDKKVKYRADVPRLVDLRRWIRAKVVKRSKRELAALLAEFPLFGFFQPLCSHCSERAVVIHPDDLRRKLSDDTRFLCEGHRGKGGAN